MTEPGVFARFVTARTGAKETATSICPSCGLRFSTTRLTHDQEIALYDDYRGPTYNAQRDLCEPGYSSRYAWLIEPRPYLAYVEQVISRYITPNTVLDIGGADGSNTPFRERATIYDIGDPAPAGKFDLVSMIHVLEHVSHPRSMISFARGRCSGLLYIEVPLEEPKSHWHEHQTQWTEKALRSVLDVRHYEVHEPPTGPVMMVVAA